ncbi:MAG TPA: lysylphosphatidylglycerol synthase transmembrane domain-containing protein [Kofleriaceae bacterium]|jgi:uncharacterized protein (TIRG00374 family)
MSERSARPAWARWVTRFSLVFAIAALVYTVHHLGLHTIGSYLKKLGWWWIAIVVFECTCTLLDATGMRAFLSPAKISLRQALLAQVSGRAINAVTPSGSLGEVVKVSVLTEYAPAERATGAILVYNLVSFGVELVVIAAAAIALLATEHLPAKIRILMIAAAIVCGIVGAVLYLLVTVGVAQSLGKLAWRLRLVSEERYLRWELSFAKIDAKFRFAPGARKRDRWLGISAVTASRLTSITLSVMLLYALGQEVTASFVLAYIVGSYGIYFLSQLAPFGVGISEAGYLEFFRALGWNPARGVSLIIARRVALVMYATIGLVLLTVNETVRRAKREAHAARVGAPAAEPAPAAEVALP